MAGPTQAVTPQAKPEEKQQQTINLQSERLPERPPHPYREAREKLEGVLINGWGKGSEPYAEMFIKQLDTSLNNDASPKQQKLAEDVYQGFVDGNLEPLKFAIQAFEQTVTAHHHQRTEESVKRLSESLSRIEGGIKGDGVDNTTPEPTAETATKTAQKAESAAAQAVKDKAPEQNADSPALEREPSRVSFHRPTGGVNVTTVNRTLRLQADGSVEMQFRAKDGSLTFLPANDPSSGLNVTALFVHDGKVYDAEGTQVESLRWNGNSISSKDALRYTEPLKEGRLSGIRDGYLKSMSYNGKDVVFTAGPPPKLSSTANEPSQSTPGTSVSPEKQVQRQAMEKAATPAKISFSQAAPNGAYRGVRRDLRLNSEGQLQMRFKGREGESVWLEPKDHTTGIKVDCLHHHQGRLYDAKGNEVRELLWGGSKIDASYVIKHMAPTQPGKVSGLKEGYLNDVRLGDRHIVFTEGLPPNIEPKPAPATLSRTNSAGNHLGSSTYYPAGEAHNAMLSQNRDMNGGRHNQTHPGNQYSQAPRLFRARRR